MELAKIFFFKWWFLHIDHATYVLFIGKKISIIFLGNNLMLCISSLKMFMLWPMTHMKNTEMFIALLVIKWENQDSGEMIL